MWYIYPNLNNLRKYPCYPSIKKASDNYPNPFGSCTKEHMLCPVKLSVLWTSSRTSAGQSCILSIRYLCPMANHRCHWWYAQGKQQNTTKGMTRTTRDCLSTFQTRIVWDWIGNLGTQRCQFILIKVLRVLINVNEKLVEINE